MSLVKADKFRRPFIGAVYVGYLKMDRPVVYSSPFHPSGQNHVAANSWLARIVGL